MDNQEEEENIKYVCACCGEECQIIEETFYYAGTHCTNGQSGKHFTGEYVSACCLSDYDEKVD